MRIQPSREDLVALTREYADERFADGRPRVSDAILERMKHVTTEQAWGVLREHGYHWQFEGRWMETHPGVITVGRAVTAQFVPHRPDFHKAIQDTGLDEGRASIGGQNSWIIEQLQDGDVMVVDIFGKIKDGTVVGDNLGSAVRNRTRAGAVIDGGIRDFQGLVRLDNVNFYIRGVDPTAIADVTLAGINIPIRIGSATVLPGDVVLGTPSGVMFIPAHLAAEVVNSGEEVRVRDEFSKLRLAQGKYTSGEIDVPTWRDDIEADFQAWRKQ
ncbi:MAG: RraA family protein [Anaerolineae bacterium]|nr:RraA family protein [Anaerolineae bacterium]